MKNIIFYAIFVLITLNTYSQTDSANIYYNSAVHKNEIADFSGAIEDCIKSRKIDCNSWNSKPALLAGMIYFNSNDFNNALLFFKSASSLYEARVMRGRCEYELKNYFEAFYQLNLAIYENRDDPSAFFYRGLTRIEMNDIEGVVRDLKYVSSFSNSYTNDAKKILKNYEKY